MTSDKAPGELALDAIAFEDWQADQRELNHREEPAADPLADLTPAEAIRGLLTLLVPGVLKNSTPATIGNKILALATLLQIGPTAGLALSDVADRIGCTRALLSHYGVQISSALKIHFRQQKIESSRETFRQARLAVVHAELDRRRAEQNERATASTRRRRAIKSGE